jgi:hypothetical protein
LYSVISTDGSLVDSLLEEVFLPQDENDKIKVTEIKVAKIKHRERILKVFLPIKASFF